jgi:hypothetical protein
VSTIPYGITIFCDDIRQEVGNKITYVGCYRSVLYVQGGFPLVLPKFGIAITYREPEEMKPEKVGLHIYLPGDPDGKPTIQGELVSEEMVKNVVEGKAPTLVAVLGDESKDLVRIREIQNTLMLSPLVISQPGTIRVRGRRGDEAVVLGALSIQPAPVVQENQNKPKKGDK